MTGQELTQKHDELTASLAHLRSEATSLTAAIGEAMLDDPARAEGLKGRLRAVRDLIESTEAALTALRPRLVLAATEENVAARVAAAAFCLGQLSLRDGAFADIDRAIRDLGDAYERAKAICAAGAGAGRVADDGHGLSGPAIGHSEVAGQPLAALFPSRAKLAMQVGHAIWSAVPDLALAIRVPTHGASKHRPVSESLGHGVTYEPEALGETLRDLAVKQSAEPTRPPALPISDDGVRIVRIA